MPILPKIGDHQSNSDLLWWSLIFFNPVWILLLWRGKLCSFHTTPSGSSVRMSKFRLEHSFLLSSPGWCRAGYGIFHCTSHGWNELICSSSQASSARLLCSCASAPQTLVMSIQDIRKILLYNYISKALILFSIDWVSWFSKMWNTLFLPSYQ